MSLQIKVSTDELRAVIDPDGLGVAHDRAGQFERLHNVLVPIAKPGVQDQREPGECGEDGQNSELSARGELVKVDPKGGEAYPMPQV